jgi:hypothetical protein
MTQRKVLPIASIPCGGYNRPIELPHLETFPGAACLPPHRAAMLSRGRETAPLQAFGPLNAQRVCSPSAFLSHRLKSLSSASRLQSLTQPLCYLC